VSRILLEVSHEVHRRLLELAEAKGLSVEQFIVERALASNTATDEGAALAELRDFLDERIRRADAGDVYKESATEVFEEAQREFRNLNATV
jgi:predicted transcriptional regulator